MGRSNTRDKGVVDIAKGKNQNTYAKRAREMEKKRKAEEKRKRRKEQKTDPKQGDVQFPTDDSAKDSR